MSGCDSELTCGQCAHGAGLDFEFSFAFQPIVDVEARRVWSYEALVRGPDNEPASHIPDRLTDGNRYRFDQSCRVKCEQLAAELDLSVNLNINFSPTPCTVRNCVSAPPSRRRARSACPWSESCSRSPKGRK